MILKFPNHKRQPIHRASAIAGVDSTLVRQWLHKGLLGKAVRGHREGRENQLHAGETLAIRFLADNLTLCRSLKEAWGRTLRLMEAIIPLSVAQPPMPPDVFSVETWGLADNGERFICQGRDQLYEAVAGSVARNWPHVHVFDISDTVYEILIGYDILALGEEETRRRFEQTYLPQLPEERWPAALAMFDDVKRRLDGDRTVTPTSERAWAPWSSAANAAWASS